MEALSNGSHGVELLSAAGGRERHCSASNEVDGTKKIIQLREQTLALWSWTGVLRLDKVFLPCEKADLVDNLPGVCISLTLGDGEKPPITFTSSLCSHCLHQVCAKSA
jgi:hypothetical protein